MLEVKLAWTVSLWRLINNDKSFCPIFLVLSVGCHGRVLSDVSAVTLSPWSLLYRNWNEGYEWSSKRRRLFLLRLGCIDDVRPNWLIFSHFIGEPKGSNYSCSIHSFTFASLKPTFIILIPLIIMERLNIFNFIIVKH